MPHVVPTYKPLIARKYLWLFLGRIMPLLSLFVITIIYSRQLSYADYGTFQSVWMYTNIINVVISFGLSSIILSTNLSLLFSFAEKHKRTITTFYIVLWIIGLTAFFFLARNFSIGVKFLMIVFMIIQNIITVVETFLIKRKKERLSFIINSFYAILFFGLHLYILFSGYSLSNLILGISVVSVLKLIAILSVPGKTETYAPVAEEKHFMKHWGYLGLNEIFGIISKWIDKIFLLYLVSASDFAIFFNGSFEIPLFGLLISVAGSFMLIEFSENLQLKSRIVDIFKENFIILSGIVFPLFFFLLFFREEIFSFAFKNKYNASVPIFAISILILPLRINNYSAILQCFSEGKKIMAGSLIDIILALALMIILYPLMGSRGIVLSIVISTYCQSFYFLWHSAKVLNVKVYSLLPIKNLAKKFLTLLALYFIMSLWLNHFSIILKLAVGALLTSITVIAGTWSYVKTFFKKNYDMVS